MDTDAPAADSPVRSDSFSTGLASPSPSKPPPGSERVVPCPGTPGATRELFLTDDLARWWDIARSCVRGEPTFHVRHPTEPVRFRLVPEWDESVKELDEVPSGPPETTSLEESVRTALAEADAGRGLSIEEALAEIERRRPELKRHRERREERERRDRERRDGEREDWEREARRRP